MDWTASGIVSSFEYVMVDPRNLNGERGTVSGILGGNITYGYYTETKAGGALTVSDCDYEEGNLLRIYYTGSVGGESERVCLGTFFVGTSSARYERGRWTGELELSSTLVRFTQDVCETDTVLAKGKSAKGWFWSAMKWVGATGTISSDVEDKAFPNAVIIDFGKPKMAVLSQIADFLGATIGVDDYGRVTMRKYVAPSLRPVSHRVMKGARSVTFSGIDYEDGKSEVVNRCVVKYADKDAGPIYGIADLPSTSPYSFARTGRRITNSYELDAMSPKTKEQADARAQRHLDDNSRPAATWSFQSFFLPYMDGDVIRLEYQDSADPGIDIDGMVSEKDVRWNQKSVRMTTTLKEVRARAM